jgi:NAD-dependent oxidoreductase involved in siderophore biosynthesis
MLKDMHYAEFAEDESAALLAAIKEYEANKWKHIGQKVGKPAKVGRIAPDSLKQPSISYSC